MSDLEDVEVNIKLKLALLWTSVMFCYIYGDYFGLFEPGNLETMLAGKMAPLGDVTQGILLGTSILMAIPALMVFFSVALKASLNRWLNIVFGAAYSIVMVITMPGAWNYYILLGVIEISLTALIVWYAWRWPRQA